MAIRWVQKVLHPKDKVSLLSPLLETLTMIGLMGLLNFGFYPDDIGFLSIHPHPFWIIVFLLALRYSLAETIGPLILIAGLYVGIFWKLENFFYFSTLRLLTDFKEPILFILLGGFIADTTHQLVLKIKALKEELTDAYKKSTNLDETNTTLSKALHKLEHRIATQQTSFIHLFQSVSFARNLNPEEIIEHMLETLTSKLGVTHCMYYELQGQKLNVTVERNIQSEQHPLNKPEEDRIIMEAFRTRGLSHIAKNIGEEDYQNNKKATSIIAAPIVSLKWDIIGVLAVREMEYSAFTQEFITLFKTVVQWWGDLLDYQYQFNQMKTKNLFDEELGAFRYFYFQKRIKEEFHRSNSYALPLVLTLLKIENWDKIDADTRITLDQVLATTLNEGKEPLQELYRYKTEGFALLTPIQTAEELEQSFQKALTAIDGLNLKPYTESSDKLRLSIVHNDYAPAYTSADEFVNQTEQKFAVHA